LAKLGTRTLAGTSARSKLGHEQGDGLTFSAEGEAYMLATLAGRRAYHDEHTASSDMETRTSKLAWAGLSWMPAIVATQRAVIKPTTSPSNC